VKRAAIYARVSTLAGQSPQMQLEALREYAANRGLAVVSELVDHGVSPDAGGPLVGFDGGPPAGVHRQLVGGGPPPMTWTPRWW